MNATRILQQTNSLNESVTSMSEQITAEVMSAMKTSNISLLKSVTEKATQLMQIQKLSTEIGKLVQAFDPENLIVVAPRRGRPRKNLEVSAPVAAVSSTPRTRNRKMRAEPGTYTSGTTYDSHLLNAFAELGGQATYSEAQRKMKDLMDEHGLLKARDLEIVTGRKARYVSLTNPRRNLLVNHGYLIKSGKNFKLTAAGEAVAKGVFERSHALAA